MSVRKGVVQSMRLKIVNPEHLEQEIRDKANAFRSMAESTKKLKDLAVERMGGTVARTEIFEEQANPIVEAIDRSNKGLPLNPKLRAVGERVKAQLVEGRPLPEEEMTQKVPLGEIATKADIEEALKGVEEEAEPPGAPPAYAPFGQLKLEAKAFGETDLGLAKVRFDTTKLSIVASGGGFSINNVPVELSDANTKLTIRGKTFTLNPRLAFVLTAEMSDKLPDEEQVAIQALLFENAMTGADWETWRDILRSAGISAKELRSNTGKKARFIRAYLDADPVGKDLNKVLGMGHKKPQSGKVVHGKFGALVVDEGQLGKGLFSAKDPDGNLVFHAKVSDGVRHLLKNSATKAQAGKGKYTEKDLATYHELAEMAGVHHKPTDVRRQLKNPAVKSAVFLPEDPKKLFDRLEILMGLHGQGNDNKEVKTEALMIADRLLKGRHLSKGQHKSIFSALAS